MSESQCNITPNKINFTVNIAVHITILFAFLSVFFIFYVSKITQSTLNNELKSNITNGINNSLNKLDIPTNRKIKEVLNSLPLNTLEKIYSNPDPIVQKQDNWLFFTVLIINIFMVFSIILTYVILRYSCNMCIPIQHIIAENLAIFGIIGVVEYLFFTRIALKFVPAPPSLLITSMFDSLKKYLSVK